MNRTVMLSRTGPNLTSGNACWETPPAIFAKLNDEFNFEIDLCADPARHLCPTYFGPSSPFHTNALQAPWAMFGKVGYCNPPYGPFVPYILRAAWLATDYGFTTALLLPMRATKAFHQYIIAPRPYGAAELRFCDKRITFWENGAPRINPKTGKPDPAPFDSIIVIYRPGSTELKVSPWNVPKHVGTPAPSPVRTIHEHPLIETPSTS